MGRILRACVRARVCARACVSFIFAAIATAVDIPIFLIVFYTRATHIRTILIPMVEMKIVVLCDLLFTILFRFRSRYYLLPMSSNTRNHPLDTYPKI
jgi:hypothetical protein